MRYSSSRPFRLRLAALVLALFMGLLSACASGPQYQNMTADEMLARGEAEFEEEDWGDAIEILDRLLLRFPNYERAADARMMLAEAYFNDGKYITAQQEFTRFVDRHPGDLRAPQAALGVCRSYAELSPIPQRDQSYTEQAFGVCSNVVQDWAGIEDEVANRAQELAQEMRAKLARKAYANAEFYAERGFPDSAVIYFELVVERFADTEWAPRAIMGIIDAYTEIGYDDEVAEWRQRLLNSYPDSPEARSLDRTADNGNDGDSGNGGAS